MIRFHAQNLPLEGLKLIDFQSLGDARGNLTRLFCSTGMLPIWPGAIVQVNHTQTTARGAVRGLHFQHPPHAERKLVTCLRGEVWDVAVDLRADSPTFLQWHAQTLSAANRRALLIPEGFAHGFQTRTSDVEMLYFHSAAFTPEAEGGLSPTDPKLGIPWPEPVSLISERDQTHPKLDKDFKGLTP